MAADFISVVVEYSESTEREQWSQISFVFETVNFVESFLSFLAISLSPYTESEVTKHCRCRSICWLLLLCVTTIVHFIEIRWTNNFPLIEMRFAQTSNFRSLHTIYMEKLLCQQIMIEAAAHSQCHRLRQKEKKGDSEVIRVTWKKMGFATKRMESIDSTTWIWLCRESNFTLQSRPFRSPLVCVCLTFVYQISFASNKCRADKFKACDQLYHEPTKNSHELIISLRRNDSDFNRSPSSRPVWQFILQHLHRPINQRNI